MPHRSYEPSDLSRMVATSQRQRAKDAIFVGTLTSYFRPGPILGLGAGCGQLSELLLAKGFDVTASDIQPFLVEYMLSRGLRAKIIDATNLSLALDRPYDNILAQSISVLITPDLATVRRTYESILAALPSGGRFVFILPNRGWGDPWSRAVDHLRIADETGFDPVYRFRHQILPSLLYGHLPVTVLRAFDGSIGRIRWRTMSAMRMALALRLCDTTGSKRRIPTLHWAASVSSTLSNAGRSMRSELGANRGGRLVREGPRSGVLSIERASG